MKKLNILIIFLIVSELILLVILATGRASDRAVENSWERKPAEKKDRAHSVPVLLYHNIVEDDKKVRSPYAVKRSVLIKQFEILRELNIKVIALEDLVTTLNQPEKFNERAVVITFDDDYPAMFKLLMPIVRDFGYPVTLFVYTDSIGRPGQGGLTWPMLRTMEKSGISVQSHSKSHADLVSLLEREGENSGKRITEEMVLSKDIIEMNLKKKVLFFAFPYGRYNLEIIEFAGYAGYQRVLSTDFGHNIITRDNYCLRRHHIKSSYSYDFFRTLIE